MKKLWVWLCLVVLCGMLLPENANALTSASTKITIFSQSGSTSAVSTLKLGSGSTSMRYSGCGIYSLMHAIQWCTNNGGGKKLSMDEGVALAKEMIAIDKYPWDGYPYNKYSKVLTAHGVKTVSEPSDEASLKAHFDKGGAIFLHQYNWGKESGHYIIAVGYVMHDVNNDGNKDFLIQIVDSAVNSSADRYNNQKMKAYRLDSYELLGNGWTGGGQYLISYENYKKHNMRRGFLPNGNNYGISEEDQEFTTVDSKTRIAVSTKTKTGNTDDDQCYIKDTPFENGKTVDVIAKGSVINVVGAVKNKHGNTWYKTEDGNYVWSGDVTVWEYSNLFSLTANFKNRKDQNSHAAPYADSDKIKAYPAGNSFKVKAFVTNSHGNIWAELADGGYMNFYDKGADLLNMDFVSHVTQPTHDTTYPTGDIKVTSSFGFRLEGKVKAQVPFLTLTTRIVDRKTEKDVTAAGSPMSVKPGASIQTIDLYSTKFDGKTVDSQTMFRKLEGTSAWYRYELNAQFGFTYAGKTFKFGSEMNLVSSNFTVGNPGTLEENPTPEVKGKLTIGSAVKNGNVLEVPVGIQGNPGLVGVSVEIGLPEEFKSFNAASEGVGASAMAYTDGLSGGKMVALMSTSTISGDGNLFRLYLPLEDLGLTEFTLKVNCASAGDADGRDILLSSAEKVIKLSSGRMPGDANDDGSVGWTDLILMLKHVSGWSVSINMTNADVTADGSVGWNDLILLLKHVSGWNVELK